jgi:hypothetical protein
VFDLTDHQIANVSMWIEVGILAFMVWEKYGPAMLKIRQPTSGYGRFVWENRTLIVAIVGLAIVAWLNFRQTNPHPSAEEIAEAVAKELSKTRDADIGTGAIGQTVIGGAPG